MIALTVIGTIITRSLFAFGYLDIKVNLLVQILKVSYWTFCAMHGKTDLFYSRHTLQWISKPVQQFYFEFPWLWRRLMRKLLFKCNCCHLCWISFFSLFIQIILWTKLRPTYSVMKKYFYSLESSSLEEQRGLYWKLSLDSFLKERQLCKGNMFFVACLSNLEAPTWISIILVDRIKIQKDLPRILCSWNIIGWRVIYEFWILKNSV